MVKNAHKSFLQFTALLKIHGNWTDRIALESSGLNFNDVNFLAGFVTGNTGFTGFVDDWPLFIDPSRDHTWIGDVDHLNINQRLTVSVNICIL